MSKATLKRVKEWEEHDTNREVFKRRMGMRQYMKELKMNIGKVKKLKEETAKKDRLEKIPEEGETKKKKSGVSKKKKKV